jgi:NADPH-dependent 2,4-dienoyl-CoA reductase/sulfur reductase-like enzyme/rhodanese-related sulfurtransferase
MKVLIVGGVAGGASCAARARRLDESAEIVLFDRGPHVSFANCGLPYFVGDVIKDEAALLVATPELFKDRFNIQVRTESDVLSIDRSAREIEVKDLKSGRVYRERYDALVLSPGAAPIRPPLPGIDLPGIFALRTIPDSRRIRKWIVDKKAKSAVIVGGGFIGLEMAENLIGSGIRTSILEMQDQVLPPFDPEMVRSLELHLTARGVALYLGDALTGFEPSPDGRLTVNAKSGLRLETDLVILSIGVRPETALAKACGLEIGERGGIRVDDSMRTSDPRVWAVGDAVEKKDFMTGEWTTVPLAGPANRQGRIAADSIFGRASRFRGVQGTAVCKAFDQVAALTGLSEKTLRRIGKPYEKVYLHPGHHAGYYPNAKPIHLKVLYEPDSGRVLGAQAVGEEGVEKRVDVIAMAVQMGADVHDLEQAELCYAPQFGAAKDPVNVAGMIAGNARNGDAPIAHWERMTSGTEFVLDVRNPEEYDTGHVPGAVNIPLNSLRARMGELPKDRPLYTYCGVGQRAYYAARALRCNGFDAKNVSGGIQMYQRPLEETSHAKEHR